MDVGGTGAAMRTRAHRRAVTGRIESLDFRQYLGPRTDDTPRRRESVHQPAAVRLGDDTWIGNDHDAAVGTAANQPAEALLEPQRRVRKHVLDERIPAPLRNRLAIGGGDRLRRYAERKFGDEQCAQGVAGDVNALPERRGAEEHRAARLTEPSEQRIARIVSVHEHGPPLFRAAYPELCRHGAHVAMAREQHEHSAVARP